MAKNGKNVLNILPNIDGTIDDIKLYVTTDKDYFKLLHSHTFFEFTFIARGKIINNADGKKVVLSQNDIMILRPECEHKLEQLSDTPYLYFNFEVNARVFRELLAELKADETKLLKDDIYYIHGSESDSAEFIRLVNLSQKVSASPQEKQFYLRLIVIRFLVKLVTDRDISETVSAGGNSTIINKVLSTLNNPDNFTLNLKQICEQLGYRQEYIIRLFKSANLQSPGKIFLRNKMIYAGTLLTTSNIKVIYIAELCGIYTTYYFYKSFKNEFGMSPTEYRKKNQIYVP